MMFFSDYIQAASDLLELYKENGLKLATAESCTGGLLAALITDIPGSSEVFAGGFVTYSNELKTNILGVSEELLAEHGAVSADVACAMAQGTIDRTGVDYAVALTGIAGPGGGNEEKPVGMVYIAVAGKNSVMGKKNMFYGNRSQIRASAVLKAIEMLKDIK